jgi:hypothetical protein
MIGLSYLMSKVFLSSWMSSNIKSISEAQQERMIIKFLFIKKDTVDKIRPRLLPLSGKAIYAATTIYKWIHKFWTGRTSIF